MSDSAKAALGFLFGVLIFCGIGIYNNAEQQANDGINRTGNVVLLSLIGLGTTYGVLNTPFE